GYVALALALGCGMTLTHHMVPPTPGPLAVTGLMGADLGLVIITGLIFTVILLPVVIVYARWMGPLLEDRVIPEVKSAVFGERVTVGGATGTAAAGSSGDDADSYDLTKHLGEHPQGAKPHRIGAFLVSLPLVVPLVLIVLNTV